MWREQTEAGHRVAIQRTVMAETKITAGELLLSLVALAVVTGSFYWLVGRVDAFAEYVPDSGLGFSDPELEGWFLRSPRGFADWATIDMIVAYRLWVGALLGAMTGLVLWTYSADLRREVAFAKDEALQVVRYEIEVRDD